MKHLYKKISSSWEKLSFNRRCRSPKRESPYPFFSYVTPLEEARYLPQPMQVSSYRAIAMKKVFRGFSFDILCDDGRTLASNVKARTFSSAKVKDKENDNMVKIEVLKKSSDEMKIRMSVTTSTGAKWYFMGF